MFMWVLGVSSTAGFLYSLSQAITCSKLPCSAKASCKYCWMMLGFYVAAIFFGITVLIATGSFR